MTRGIFRPDGTSGERFFRWRGGDVSRLEGLADAVFALALTLLVVRLEVPQTFDEVRTALLRAPVYLACFALFLWTWFCHYQFHRRYGLDDALTVTLDGAILFVVLMFALPLRFVADTILNSIQYGQPIVLDRAGQPVLGPSGEPLLALATEDGSFLMFAYSGGFALVFALFAIQTWNAFARRERLQLDALEVAVTRHTILAHTASAVVGLLALVVTAVGSSLGGVVFFLMGPVHGVLGYLRGKRLTELAQREGVIDA